MTDAHRDRQAMFQAGLDAYRSGLHYEAHEHWEELWNEEDDADRRRYLQALIQVASAVHKLVNNVGPRGSLRLLSRASELLEGLSDELSEIHLGRLREGITRCLEEATRTVAVGSAGLRPELIPPIEPRETSSTPQTEMPRTEMPRTEMPRRKPLAPRSS